MTRRYVYLLTEEELGRVLAEEDLPVEVLGRHGSTVEFATYRPIGGLEPVRTEEVSDDWVNWKRSFGPVDVADFVIVPPWKKPVYINPGTAFGTGLHPTTQLCIELLSEYVEVGMSILDVGTGSGILSIVAKKLGAGRVVAIDVSEDAVRECRKNSELNSVEIECIRAAPSEIEESFDLVVANLELSIFRRELENIFRLFKRRAVFSGIYGDMEIGEFRDMLLRLGSGTDRILVRENWYAVGVKHEQDKETD